MSNAPLQAQSLTRDAMRNISLLFDQLSARDDEYLGERRFLGMRWPPQMHPLPQLVRRFAGWPHNVPKGLNQFETSGTGVFCSCAL